MVKDGFVVLDTKTGKAPDLESIALEEEWAKNLMWCDMEGFAIEEDGTLVLNDECGCFAYPPEGRFQVVRLNETKDLYIYIENQQAEIKRLREALESLFNNNGDEDYEKFYTRAYRLVDGLGLIKHSDNEPEALK